MSDFLREIEEDLRAERLGALWKRIAPLVIVGCVVIVLATAAGVAWKHHVHTAAQSRTGELIAALKNTDANARNQALAQLVMAYPNTPQAALAQMELGADALNAEKGADALKEYKAVTESSAPESLRMPAYVMAYHAAAEAKAPLELSTADDPNALGPLLREAKAWHLASQGKTQEAADAFGELAQEVIASPATRMRAAQAAAYFAP